MWVFSVFERELVVVESCFEFMFCHTNAGLCITRSCCESCFVDNVLGKARTVKNSQNVWTNIAKSFLCLIDKHFPKSNKLHKIFNRNNLKVSYSCTTNMANIIQSRNRKILNENDKAPMRRNETAETKSFALLMALQCKKYMYYHLPFTIYCITCANHWMPCITCANHKWAQMNKRVECYSPGAKALLDCYRRLWPGGLI